MQGKDIFISVHTGLGKMSFFSLLSHETIICTHYVQVDRKNLIAIINVILISSDVSDR